MRTLDYYAHNDLRPRYRDRYRYYRQFGIGVLEALWRAL